MAAALAPPGVPVAEEQVGIDPRLRFAGPFRVQILLVACIVGAAFGIHLAGEYEVFAIGREELSVGLSRQVRYLTGVAAVTIHHPDLGRASAIGNVRDLLGIG